MGRELIAGVLAVVILPANGAQAAGAQIFTSPCSTSCAHNYEHCVIVLKDIKMCETRAAACNRACVAQKGDPLRPVP